MGRSIRQQIINLLSHDEMSARDLSQMLGIKEKEVYEHLSHIALSVAARKKKTYNSPFQMFTVRVYL
ncbi:MAG: ArsR family transcriptional regulator [Deltaproteobacteria bacterium]|nr:ArsR family transcriptional regulator [Deltaproteobacteria bacterium]